MIKRKLALLGTAVAVSLLMTVPAFAADTKDTDTAQNAQNTQSVQEEKTEENTGYVTCSVLNVRRASSEKSDKVGTLKRGEEVKILRDEENGWYAIDFEGHIRYYNRSGRGERLYSQQLGWACSDCFGRYDYRTERQGDLLQSEYVWGCQHYEKSWQYR